MDRHVLDAKSMSTVLAAIKLPTENVLFKKKGCASRIRLSREIEGIRDEWEFEDVSATIAFD